MSDFMTIRNEWRDQLLKEYAEQEYNNFNNRYTSDCNQIKMFLEKNAYELIPSYATISAPRNPEAARRRMEKYKGIVDEWEECEKQKNSWKYKLR